MTDPSKTTLPAAVERLTSSAALAVRWMYLFDQFLFILFWPKSEKRFI